MARRSLETHDHSGTGNGGDNLSPDTVDANQVTTEEGEITGETVVKAELNSSINGLSAASFETFVDTEVEDNRAELDGSFVFTPDKTADYLIVGNVYLTGGSTGDQSQVAIRDVDANSSVKVNNFWQASPEASETFAWNIELTAGTNYNLVARNVDSSYNINNGSLSGGTHFTIRRSVVDA